MIDEQIWSNSLIKIKLKFDFIKSKLIQPISISDYFNDTKKQFYFWIDQIAKNIHIEKEGKNRTLKEKEKKSNGMMMRNKERYLILTIIIYIKVCKVKKRKIFKRVIMLRIRKSSRNCKWFNNLLVN